MRPFANYYPPFGSPEKESKASFNVLIVYEDFETGKQAKRTFDFLAEQLKSDCVLMNQMWKFDVLNIPKLREMAAKDAAAADVVIISCHAHAQLAPEVQAWIELWLAENNQAVALVALLDTSAEKRMESAALRHYLSEVTLRGNMEFFAQPDDLTGAVHSTQSSAKPQSALAVASLAQAVEREAAFPRWGINE
jgi:hypothetical protein